MIPAAAAHAAPPLEVSDWLNAPAPLTLDGLRGRVVALHAFQMLCPGCVAHGVPQAQRLQRTFDESELAVIGLHTVFEHHAVMGAQALRVFVSEYRVTFPVGIDAPGDEGPIPRTMAAYGLRGTPSLVLIDRAGRVRLNHFGAADDLALGAVIGRLLSEPVEG
ncbi:redoxin family protein [Aquabacterium humicola]|uniref:redoxin family protein n=1 Tax=Aquabacterium humicola TaxID=3237377 RepID=UPI002543D752|nr:redoxin family protein [Rubrivivax pictus]